MQFFTGVSGKVTNYSAGVDDLKRSKFNAYSLFNILITCFYWFYLFLSIL